MTRSKVSLTAALIAHILAWAATIFFLFGPVYRPTGATLIEVNGLSAALLIVIPVALTAITLNASLPGATRPGLMLILRWAAFVLLLIFCIAGALSIGIFYLPAAVAALVAAISCKSAYLIRH